MLPPYFFLGPTVTPHCLSSRIATACEDVRCVDVEEKGCRAGSLRSPLAVVRVKLRLPTSSMIKRTMRLSGSNRSNLQVQAALIAVSDVIKGLFGS